MAFKERKRFSFVSKGLSEDTFEVVRFRGEEGISRLFQFDIVLISEDPEVDIDTVLQNPAIFTIHRGEEDRKIHGIISEFEQMHEVDQYTFYQASLVPRIWLSDLYRENQLFLDKTVPDIIEEILKQAGLTTKDYELKLTRNYPKWEYICQYKETDLNFISRWMEREGIYYYFEHTDEGEKLIITDSSTAHTEIQGESTIPYSPPSALIPEEEEVIKTFMCRQKVLPKKIVLKDYNYRKPSLDLKVEKEVNPKGRGTVYLYGEHFKDPDQGKELAKLRAEQIACRGKLFMGESSCPQLCPGFLFELADHYRETFNQKYLIVELEHEGSQAGILLAGLETEEAQGEKEPAYVNRFTLIPSDVQFRPEVKTPKPRFYGTINAKIDASGDGKYAEIDDQGRYKVILPFDMSGREGGKASRWIRMAQPYAGADFGMHFPLHKGTEVLLTFVDGDPDRPIIAAAVPNPETKTPVTSENQTQCVIRTGGGNQIHMEDQDGSQLIRIQSPTANSFVRIGAPNPNGDTGIQQCTDENMATVIGGWETRRVGSTGSLSPKGKQYVKVQGDRYLEVTGKEDIKIQGDQIQDISTRQDITVHGPQKVHVTGTQEITSDQSRTITAPQGETKVIGTQRKLTVNGAEDITVNGNRTLTATTETYKVTGARSVTVGTETKTVTNQTKFLGMDAQTDSGAKFENFAGLKVSNHFALLMELKQISIAVTNASIGYTSFKCEQSGFEVNTSPLHVIG